MSGWDFGFFTEHGKWMLSVQHGGYVLATNPWPIHSRVRLAGDSRTGVVRGNAWADEYGFRVRYADGTWAPKSSSHELRTAPGWGVWNWALRGAHRLPGYLREYIEDAA